MKVIQSASFTAFRNRHQGKSILICGCGESLNLVRERQPDCITIGVNDVGRLFNPDYLVVLNQKNQFARGRYAYVENSNARAVFSQYRLRLKQAPLVQFALGKFAGTDIEDPHSLPYTKNSPYVAVCLAAYMGAMEIGLLGVDFTDHHFFGKTGRHPLAGTLEKISREYHQLAVSLRAKNVRLVNLSPSSRLTGLEKISLREFLRGENAKSSSAVKPASFGCERNVAMNIQIEKHNGGLVGNFMDALAGSVESLGYGVTRVPSRQDGERSTLKIVWNGRNCRNHNNIIYCEHGWLPREAYQISPKGINADSHIAPFLWDNRLLPELQREQVATYLQSLRQQGKFSLEYMRTDVPVAADLPAEFLLVPLQMENDTNILRHVEPGLRHMQWVIDYISRANPPYPVIYKQHPADVRRGNGQLRLRVRRRIDHIRAHGLGNIHQILKSGACKGIVSLNSNVVHDGFLWDVPAVVLGRNIWPRDGISPFINGLPDDWNCLNKFYFDQKVAACRESYIHFIMSNQWTLEDAKKPDRVDGLLLHKLNALKSHNIISLSTVGRPREPAAKTMVNIVAKNRGWLFEDLKSHFVALRMPGIQIIASEKPVRRADAWIFLRSDEAGDSPDPSRTVVQIHDQFDNGYGPDGRRRPIKNCAALSFTHPDQEKLIKTSGIDLAGKAILIKPLGASRRFQLRQKMSRRFTVGWIGRPVEYQGRDIKRLVWFSEALTKLSWSEDLAVMLVGDRLGDFAALTARTGILCNHYPRQKYAHSQYPELYQNMDCVVVTSEFAAGPNCLFESLTAGVPVIATPCGWVETLIRDGENGFIVRSPSEIATAIDRIRNDREGWFNRREMIQRSVAGYCLEHWAEENIRLAVSLVRRYGMDRNLLESITRAVVR